MTRIARLLAVLVVSVSIVGCGDNTDDPSTMPDLVGKRLDVAKGDLSAAGIDEDNVEVIGGGTFGVIDESNWTVCEQEPSPGSTVSDVRLVVDRECEEADAETESDEPEPAPEAAPTSVPAPEPAPEVAARPVAEAETRWLEIMGVDAPTDLLAQDGYDFFAPLHAIVPGWGGTTDGYLRIQVQQPLNDEEVKRLGINVLNLVGPEFRGIEGVVFTDSDGIDHNFLRRDAPGADFGP